MPPSSSNPAPTVEEECAPRPALHRPGSGVRSSTAGRSASELEALLSDAEAEAAVRHGARALHSLAHDPVAFVDGAAALLEHTFGCAYVGLAVDEWPEMVSITREPRPLLSPDAEPDDRSELRVPIRMAERALGELRLHGGSKPLDDRERARARWLADALAGPLASEHWASRVQRLDPTDGLTGLRSRRTAIRRLQEEIARAHRYDLPLGLLLCAIDGDASEATIRQVGGALRASLRDVDFAARWTGQAFLLLLPHQSTDGVRVVAERVHRWIGALPIDPAVTLSVGAASLAASESVVPLVGRAEEALGRARDAGGDRVCFASDRSG